MAERNDSPNFNKEHLDAMVIKAAEIARHRNNELVSVDHLVCACMDDPDFRKVLADLNFDVDGFAVEFRDYMDEVHPSAPYPVSQRATQDFATVVLKCGANIQFSGRRTILVADIIVAVLQLADFHAAYFLNKYGLDPVELKDYITEHSDEAFTDESEEGDGSNGGTYRNMSPDKAKKVLRKYCVNLNEMAYKGKIDPLIGREDVIYNVVKTMARRTKNNVILTGEPGVGKTAIAEGLAKLIVEGNVPESLQGYTVWALDVPGLIAGAKFRGDMEERAKMVIAALEIVEKPILFIDEIHMIMGAGAAGEGKAMDLSNMLKPALAKGTLHCIGATTMDEYRKHFEQDKALTRRFMRHDVAEPSIADAKRILAGAKKVYENFFGITYTDEAIDAAVELSAQYITGKFLPDKAFDLIDAAGATQRVSKPDERVHEITAELIENEVALVAKIPAKTVKESEADKLAHLEADLLANVHGQNEAVTKLADAVIMSRAGLREASKPAGVFLFKGPTGVGKTEAAKQLAETLGIKLLRYDMSEYMEKHAVSKLIGSPPGYVGYGDGSAGEGKLINDIETNPHCVLLLDEMEKAHPDIFNIFLQVFDNAGLKSSNGKEVNFQNVIIIMTSNVGARFANKAAIGFGAIDRNRNDDTALKDTFAPEFLNRLDAIVDFKPLGKDVVLRIVDKFIGELNKLAEPRNVRIEVLDEARDWLATKGYDPDMGARPLKRVIQDNISKPLSKAMLFGEVKNGGLVSVGVVDGELVLKYSELPEINFAGTSPAVEAAEAL